MHLQGGRKRPLCGLVQPARHLGQHETRRDPVGVACCQPLPLFRPARTRVVPGVLLAVAGHGGHR
jgi:hypothetical protein